MLSIWNQLESNNAPSYMHRLKVGDSPESAIRLASWMLFPDRNEDNELRDAYCFDARSVLLRADLNRYSQSQKTNQENEQPVLLDSGSSITLRPQTFFEPAPIMIMPDDMVYLIGHPPTLCTQLALKNSRDALMVGSLLTYMRLFKITENNHGALFAKAKAVALWQDRPNRDKTKYSQESIKPRKHYCKEALDDAWLKFAPVSHLWAALLSLRKFDLTPLGDPLNQVSIVDLISIADLYLDWGVKFYWGKAKVGGIRNHHFSFIKVTYEGKRNPTNQDFSKLPWYDVAMSFIHEEKTKGRP